MTQKNIRYEVGTFLPCTQQKGFGPYKSLADATWFNENDQGSIAYFHVFHPYGCTQPEPGVIFFFAIKAKNPVDTYHELSGFLLPVRCWDWGILPDDLDENAWKDDREKYRFMDKYFLEQTFRVDRKQIGIEINRHGHGKNLIVGFADNRGVKSFSIFLFEEPDAEGRFAKMSLFRFPGQYIEDEFEKLEFLGYFLKHWWEPKAGPSSPFIFHKQKAR
jgi:hypothetical protein